VKSTVVVVVKKSLNISLMQLKYTVVQIQNDVSKP